MKRGELLLCTLVLCSAMHSAVGEVGGAVIYGVAAFVIVFLQWEP